MVTATFTSKKPQRKGVNGGEGEGQDEENGEGGEEVGRGRMKKMGSGRRGQLGTFLRERAGRAGGKSLTWWWKASKCIDRWCPTGGDSRTD